MFALTRDCLRAGTDVILEGNFRPGEHEVALSTSIRDANTSVSNERNTSDLYAAIAPAFNRSASVASAPTANDAPRAVRITQILCRTPEPVRIARLKARATDPSRHAGHRDADLAANPASDRAEADPTPDPTVAFSSAPATGSSPLSVRLSRAPQRTLRV